MNRLELYGNLEIIKAQIFKEMISTGTHKIKMETISDALHFLNIKILDLENDRDLILEGNEIFITDVNKMKDNLVMIKRMYDDEKRFLMINHLILKIIQKIHHHFSRSASFDDFLGMDPRSQFRNLILLGYISIDSNGGFLQDNKEYQEKIKETIEAHEKQKNEKLKLILDKLK